MAHTCPECDQVCHCGGDIDDIEMNDSVAQAHCTHWKTCESDDYDPKYDNDFFDELDDLYEFKRPRHWRKPSHKLKKQPRIAYIYDNTISYFSHRTHVLIRNKNWDLPF